MLLGLLHFVRNDNIPINNKTRLLIFLLFTATAVSFVFFWPDDKVHLIACDVGQGDGILITKGFTQILIDGGPNDRVLGCLARNMPFWDRTIELIINTHQDKDHIYGLNSVIQRYSLKYLVINSTAVESKLFADFHQQVRERKIKVYTPARGEKIKINGIRFTFLWPEEKQGELAFWRRPLPEKNSVLGASTYTDKANDSSIVALMEYGDFDALLTGDVPAGGEAGIVDYCRMNDCGGPLEVLKVAHHGSKTSTSQTLVDFFEPKIAIISVGENSWGHPTEEVLGRLKSAGSKILQTKQLGDVKITTDGKKMY